jgi:hypothetical protein
MLCPLPISFKLSRFYQPSGQCSQAGGLHKCKKPPGVTLMAFDFLAKAN